MSKIQQEKNRKKGKTGHGDQSRMNLGGGEGVLPARTLHQYQRGQKDCKDLKLRRTSACAVNWGTVCSIEGELYGW